MSDSSLPSPTTLASVARPKQARSEASLQRLLEAAEALSRERDSREDVSISQLTKRAKSSVGGFYARFKDKYELLLALHERVQDVRRKYISPHRIVVVIAGHNDEREG